MKIIKRREYYYLGHSFRKKGEVVYKEIYLGKNIPKNIEELKEKLLRQCLQEEVIIKLNKIKKRPFRKERSFKLHKISYRLLKKITLKPPLTQIQGILRLYPFN